MSQLKPKLLSLILMVMSIQKKNLIKSKNLQNSLNCKESGYLTKYERLSILFAELFRTVPIDDIAYRDTESYFGILYKDLLTQETEGAICQPLDILKGADANGYI